MFPEELELPPDMLVEVAADRERRLYECVKEYYVATETYDQTVCTMRDQDGQAMPATPAERSQITSNASRQWKESLTKSRATEHAFREASRRFALSPEWRDTLKSIIRPPGTPT